MFIQFYSSNNLFKEKRMSLFKSLCYIAGSMVITAFLANPIQAQPLQLDKKGSYKVEQVKKGKKKGKRAKKAA